MTDSPSALAPGAAAEDERPDALARSAVQPGAGAEVVVLDYGGQYSQLIARRVRDCHVFSELLPHDTSPEELARRAPRGIILSGGPASVYAPGAPRLDRRLFQLVAPALGIFYVMRLLAPELGGRTDQAQAWDIRRSDLD